MNLKACIIDSLEEFRSLQDAYVQVTKANTPRLPFVSHRWLTAWWQAFGHMGKVRIFCLTDGGTFHAAIPLLFDVGRLARLPLRRASFLGGSWSLIDLPASPHANGWENRFLSWLYTPQAPRWDFLELGPIQTSSKRFDSLLLALTRNRVPHNVLPAPNPYLPLPGSWQEFLREKSSNFRRTIKRKERHLDTTGAYSIQRILNPTHDQLRDTVFEVSQRSWQGRSGKAIAASPAGQAFYGYLADGQGEFDFDLTIMRDGERCIAYLVGFNQDGIHHAFDTGFDPSHAEVSPGLLVHFRAIREACDGKVTEFNFGYTQGYKDRFEPRYHPSATILVFRNSVVRTLNDIADAIKTALARFASIGAGHTNPIRPKPSEPFTTTL